MREKKILESFNTFFSMGEILELGELCPVLMDSLMGMYEWVSDSRESAWLANPCELRIRMIDVLCPHLLGSAYGMAIRTISKKRAVEGTQRVTLFTWQGKLICKIIMFRTILLLGF